MGRFRGRQHTEPTAGGESCRLCGARVPVGPDGRCRLGHPVREPGAAPPAPLPDEVHADAPAVQEDPAEAAGAPAAVQTAERPAAVQTAERPDAVRDDVGTAVEPVAAALARIGLGRTGLGAAPKPQPPAPIPAAGTPAPYDPSPGADAAPWHPYDEVLAAGPRAPGPQGAPTSAPEAPTADTSRSPLEYLLSWDAPMQSALDVPVEEPAPTTATDVDAADPAPAPAEASVAEDASGRAGEESSAADEKASGTAQTAHRGLSVLLGSGALALLALAAFAVASML